MKELIIGSVIIIMFLNLFIEMKDWKMAVMFFLAALSLSLTGCGDSSSSTSSDASQVTITQQSFDDLKARAYKACITNHPEDTVLHPKTYYENIYNEAVDFSEVNLTGCQADFRTYQEYCLANFEYDMHWRTVECYE